MIVEWLDINSSYSHSNLAFPAMHAQLGEGYDDVVWEVVRGTINSPMSELINKTLELAPDVIMATAWLFNHEYILALLDDIHSLLPNVKIVLGGPEFLGTAAENKYYLRKNPFVFGVFRGEGEEQFPLLIDALLGKGDFRKIEGWCFVDRGVDAGVGIGVGVGVGAGVGDLRPVAEYFDAGVAIVRDFGSLAEPEKSEFFDWTKPFVQLETSRGCFNSCAFCVSGINNSILNLDISTLRDRLSVIASKGIQEIRVLDRTFNANLKRARELVELFSEFAGRLKFHIEVHPAFLEDKLLTDIDNAPAGLLHVEVGIQSLSDAVLTKCCRKGGARRALDGVKRLLSLNKFEVHSDLIVGLPGFSYEMLVADTLELMATGSQEVQIELLKCLPGTIMRDEAVAFGLMYSNRPPYRVLQSDSMSFMELEKARMLSKIVDHWYNDSSVREFFYSLLLRERALLSDFCDYCFSRDILDKNMSKESRWVLLYEFVAEAFPSLLDLVSVGWVKNGFSIKKKPAAFFRQWHFSDDLENPIFVKDRPTFIYYFLPSSEGVYWVCYDRDISRSVPVEMSFVGLS